MRDSLSGEVRFIFQHAEEQLPGGARDVVAAGALDGVDAVVGCHLLSVLDLGTVAVPTGPFMAAPDTFAIVVEGRGGHAAFPQECVDPIAVAAQVVRRAPARRRARDRSERARRRHGLADRGRHGRQHHPGVGRARRHGSHVQRRGARATRAASIERIVAGVTQAHDATYRLDYVEGYLPVDNDAELAVRVKAAAERALGADALIDIPPIMGGDDFSAYQQEAPGVYFMVGARSEEANALFPHHHPRFAIDERGDGERDRRLHRDDARAARRRVTAA